MSSPATITPRVTVPPVRVVFEEEDRKAILHELDACLASGMVAAGKKVQELEETWASYCRAKYAVGCANGGSALLILMSALNVKGKDVLVPTNTFIATVNAISLAGGNPVFLDTDPATMGVSLAEIQAKVTPNTLGVVVVHIGGIMTPEMEKIAAWCKAKGLWLVEDAAHAHGSESAGRRAGSFGVAAAYSFFATKTMTSGEGGAVVTNDEGLAQLCRSYADYGKRSQWESFHTLISMNHRMCDLTAIVALSQLRRLDDFIASREATAAGFTKGLKGRLDLVLPVGRSSWYKYIAVLPSHIDRNAFKAKVKQRGVSLSGGVYDLPVHLQSVFQPASLAGKFPRAERLCASHICLPMFYGMTRDQAHATVDAVLSTLQEMHG